MTERERLVQERRSFIIGTLLVLGVAVGAASALYIILLGSLPATVSEMAQRLTKLEASLTWQQYISVQLIYWAGGAGLFFLNFRFSLLLRRPFKAFQPTRSPARALWWVVLFMNSVFYTFLFPQLMITWLLAHWGSDAIARLDAQSAAQGRGEEGHS